MIRMPEAESVSSYASPASGWPATSGAAASAVQHSSITVSLSEATSYITTTSHNLVHKAPDSFEAWTAIYVPLMITLDAVSSDTRLDGVAIMHTSKKGCQHPHRHWIILKGDLLNAKADTLYTVGITDGRVTVCDAG